MKDLIQNTSHKKLPWRRKYQQAKVSNLLHSAEEKRQFCSILQTKVESYENHRNKPSDSSGTLDHEQTFSNGHNPRACISDETISSSAAKCERKATVKSCDFGKQEHNKVNGKFGNESEDKLSTCLRTTLSFYPKTNGHEVSTSLQEPAVTEVNSKANGLHIAAKPKQDESLLFRRYLFAFPATKDISTSTKQNAADICRVHNECNDSHYGEIKSKPKARRARIDRRHTASGISAAVSMKEIEDWIAASSEKRDDLYKTKDDSELLIAKPKIVHIKLAEKKTCHNWRIKTNGKISQATKEESKLATLRCTSEKERKCSCSDMSVLAKQDDIIVSSKEKVCAGRESVSYRLFESKEENASISLGVKRKKPTANTNINNGVNCFLTPRSNKTYMADQQAMQSFRRSWNGYEEDKNASMDGSNSLELHGGVRKLNRTSYAPYIEDDDDRLVRNRMNTSSDGCGCESKYKTFLDLSNLNLDEEPYQSQESSSESAMTSLSDSEISNERNEYENSGNSRNQNGDISDVMSIISCRSLDKIDEEPTEEEEENSKTSIEDQDADSSSLSREEAIESSSNFDEEVYDTKEIVPKTTFAENHDEADMCEAESEVENAVEPLSGDNLSEDEYHVDAIAAKTLQKDTDESSADFADSSSHASESDLTSNTDDVILKDTAGSKLSDDTETTSFASASFESCASNESGNQEEYELAEEKIKKNISLDRKEFIKGSVYKQTRGKRKSMPCDMRVLSEDFTVNADHSSFLDDKSTLRSGLTRLFQIAMSTVDGKNRPDAQIKNILEFIETKGIKLSDPRIRQTIQRVEKESNGAESQLDLDVFVRVFEPCFKFVRSIFLSQLTIPGFGIFKLRMSRIFENLQAAVKRETECATTVDTYSSYNGIMRKLKPGKSLISMSVCTVDGQRCSFGNIETPHPLNACSAVFNFCLACQQNGIEAVSMLIDRRKPAANQNEFLLGPKEKVCNPFTKAGSFVSSTLLFRDVEVESRLSYLHEFYRSLIGQEPLCCDNLSYNYKRIYAHDEIGLAYYLSATQRLPKGTSSDLADVLDFHFQGASSAVLSDACSVAATTLANGGVCPLTGEAVLKPINVEHTLNVMRDCSLITQNESDDETKRLAVTFNDHGSLMLVIPGVLGITCFFQCQSQEVMHRLADCLCKDLLSTFNFGVYRSLKDGRNAFFNG